MNTYEKASKILWNNTDINLENENDTIYQMIDTLLASRVESSNIEINKDDDNYDELDWVQLNLSEFNYYHNTNK